MLSRRGNWNLHDACALQNQRDVTLPKSPRPGHNLTSQINFTHHLELVLIKSICGQKLGEKYEWTMTQNKVMVATLKICPRFSQRTIPVSSQ